MGTQLWLQQAELYKSLRDYDTVRAALACCEEVGKDAREALAKEAEGDYQEARSIYHQVCARAAIPDFTLAVLL